MENKHIYYCFDTKSTSVFLQLPYLHFNGYKILSKFPSHKKHGLGPQR
jgi:hypothetical protein